MLIDLIHRYVLVSSNRERAHLRGLALIATREMKKHSMQAELTSDRVDSAAVVQAFIDMLTPPIDKDFPEYLRIDLSSMVLDYVSALSQTNRDRTVEIARCALERLWVEFETDSRGLLFQSLQETRQYMGAILVTVR
jgi:hypothetical protein